MLHLVSQLQHSAAGFCHQFIPGLTFLLINMEHFLPEDIVGQRGLDIPNTHLAEIPQ